MRISALEIVNFKAIRRFGATDLGQMVVIAGANGSGKTCVLDAIRMLKVRLGSNSTADYRTWLSEFQIAPESRSGSKSLFRDPDRPIEIRAVFEVEEEELAFVMANVEQLYAPIAWQELLNNPELNQQPVESLAAQFPHLVDEVVRRTQARIATMNEEVSAGPFAVNLEEHSDGRTVASVHPTLQTMLKAYALPDVGTIEYFGASRNYQRESLGGVNIGELPRRAPYPMHSVVNWQAKLTGVKSELAASYIRALVQSQATEQPERSNLDATLEDLFETFFPDKSYRGVVPTADGSLEFPVTLSTGEEHDINELSSGEKEIVYGYLRLRSAGLRRSIILMDEPELHLNPALLQGLPDFYGRNLVLPGANQMWLVTHSDAILRQVVQNSMYSVLHLQQATLTAGDANQAQPVQSDDMVEKVLLDLVGDLALYRPRGNVVIFEGGGDADFDVEMTRRLFPELPKIANLISAGSKQKVSGLYEVLAKASADGILAYSFFAVTDRDSDPDIPGAGISAIRNWDVYHIENYLLEPRFVSQVLSAVTLEPAMPPDQVLSALAECARELLEDMVAERIATRIDQELVKAISVGGPKGEPDIGLRFGASIAATFGRLSDSQLLWSNPDNVRVAALELRRDLGARLGNGEWVKEFRGRDVLKRFVGKYGRARVSYEGFRNLIIGAMADEGYQPAGMKKVLIDDFGLTTA